MPGKLNTVAIIPARGGSKGIPRKNLQVLGDKPLIAWPIQLAQSISKIDRVIVSSDDNEIIEVSKSYGAEVPFIRPTDLCQDETPTYPVLKHTVKYLMDKENYYPDIVVLLYATTPFLRKERIKEGISILADSEFESVIGVRKVKGLVWKKESNTDEIRPFYPKERSNRQYFTHLLEEAGNIYITKTQVIIEQNRLINESKCGYIEIQPEEVMDIDEPTDFERAKKIYKEHHL